MPRMSILPVLVAALTAKSLQGQIHETMGPRRGTLVLDGGGAALDSSSRQRAVIQRFVQLAGGSAARIVVIPTAYSGRGEEWLTSEGQGRMHALARYVMGVDHVTIMHTRDRKQADSPEFVAPLSEATGVWVTGGKDSYLLDTYVGTQVETEVKALLTRGGVVTGTSAGAVLLGSLAIEGTYVDSAGTAALRVEWTHAGWGLLTNSAVMPHWSERRRPDFAAPLASNPGLLGLAIDEDAAAVVRGTRLELIGNGHLAIYDGKVHGDKPYLLLSPGDRFDLHARSPISTR